MAHIVFQNSDTLIQAALSTPVCVAWLQRAVAAALPLRPPKMPLARFTNIVRWLCITGICPRIKDETPPVLASTITCLSVNVDAMFAPNTRVVYIDPITREEIDVFVGSPPCIASNTIAFTTPMAAFLYTTRPDLAMMIPLLQNIVRYGAATMAVATTNTLDDDDMHAALLANVEDTLQRTVVQIADEPPTEEILIRATPAVTITPIAQRHPPRFQNVVDAITRARSALPPFTNDDLVYLSEALREYFAVIKIRGRGVAWSESAAFVRLSTLAVVPGESVDFANTTAPAPKRPRTQAPQSPESSESDKEDD